MILPTNQLVTELLDLGVNTVSNPRDETVFIPSPEWLNEFGDWLHADVLNSWQAGKFDCDDFAIRAVDRATESLVRNGDAENCGHAFCYAEIYLATARTIFTIEGPGWHAANIVRCVDGWHYFEPQVGKHDLLSRFLDDGSIAAMRYVWL
jgi:hypothetical protein